MKIWNHPVTNWDLKVDHRFLPRCVSPDREWDSENGLTRANRRRSDLWRLIIPWLNEKSIEQMKFASHDHVWHSKMKGCHLNRLTVRDRGMAHSRTETSLSTTGFFLVVPCQKDSEIPKLGWLDLADDEVISDVRSSSDWTRNRSNECHSSHVTRSDWVNEMMSVV